MILKAAIEAVLSVCVPPQSSLEKSPMDTTRTSSLTTTPNPTARPATSTTPSKHKTPTPNTNPPNKPKHPQHPTQTKNRPRNRQTLPGRFYRDDVCLRRYLQLFQKYPAPPPPAKPFGRPTPTAALDAPGIVQGPEQRFWEGRGEHEGRGSTLFQKGVPLPSSRHPSYFTAPARPDARTDRPPRHWRPAGPAA